MASIDFSNSAPVATFHTSIQIFWKCSIVMSHNAHVFYIYSCPSNFLKLYVQWLDLTLFRNDTQYNFQLLFVASWRLSKKLEYSGKKGENKMRSLHCRILTYPFKTTMPELTDHFIHSFIHLFIHDGFNCKKKSHYLHQFDEFFSAIVIFFFFFQFLLFSKI